MPGAADTLFLPVSSNEVAVANGPWLYLGARAPDNGFPEQLQDQLVCEQPLRAPFLDLEMRGLDVTPQLPSSQDYVGAFILIGKHRGENEALVSRASAFCADGAKIVIAGEKTSGIASLRKRLSQFITIQGSMAKNHATAFWLSNSGDLRCASFGKKMSHPEGYQTDAGMFSPEKIDLGSKLLADHIDKGVQGAVADFGAGWGYLSQQVIVQGSPTSLDLYEAHWPSLQAAKANLKASSHLPIEFHWIDITSEAVKRRFNWIVMNPPFHTGRKTEPSLGQQFIEAAARSLKTRGCLLMVANAGLPYEKTLAENFARVEKLDQRDGFKILLGKK